MDHPPQRPKRTLTEPRTPIAGLRARLGMTRATFARLFGCSERSLAGWESGRKEPGELALRQLRQLRRIVDSAARVMEPEHVAAWLFTPNDALEGFKPSELVERGELDRVWRLLFAVESGGHV
jgi:transcriptional regulator with XRE-family HTH domain